MAEVVALYLNASSCINLMHCCSCCVDDANGMSFGSCYFQKPLSWYYCTKHGREWDFTKNHQGQPLLCIQDVEEQMEKNGEPASIMAQEKQSFCWIWQLRNWTSSYCWLFTKLNPLITNLPNFHDHLTNQLMLIEIDTDTAIKLALHLKKVQLDAMSNGDDFVPIFHLSNYTRCVWPKAVTRQKTPLKLLELKERQGMPNYLENSLRGWLQKLTAMRVTECFYLKAQFIFLAQQPMHKSSKKIISSSTTWQQSPSTWNMLHGT